MTPRDRLEQFKANHRKSLAGDYCHSCYEAWPCTLSRLVAFTEAILDNIEGLTLLGASPVVSPNDQEIYRNVAIALRTLAEQHLGGAEGT